MRTNSNVIYRRLGNDIVLYNLQTDRFYELNGTAARFWELLNEGSNPGQIREQLLTEFAVDAAQLDGEAAALIDSLRREDLITH
jgi:Coenzyme PQQ synthesis protein D (PqqD)